MLQSRIVISSLFFIISSTANAQLISKYAGNYTSGYSGNGGAATSASLTMPAGVCADKTGNVYIADYGNHVIRKVDASGIITTIAGNNTQGYSGDGGPATSAQLYHPTRVALDNAGNIYIADAWNNVIRKINTSGIITTVAGNHTAGYSGDGGPAISAQLEDPNGVYADAAGNIYIADSHNNVIRKVNSSGTISTFIGNGYNAGTTNGGYSGDGGPATSAELWYPESVTMDAVGNFYVAELFNNTVRKVNTSGVISTIAGTNTPGYSGDGGPATAAKLHGPYDVAINSAGTIFIADNGNNVVRSIDAIGNIHTYAGDGSAGNSGDGGSPTAAELDVPVSVSIGQYDNLYIADANNNAIRMVGPWLASVHAASIAAEKLDVYPNPTTGRFNVALSSAHTEAVNVVITNIVGQPIKEFTTVANHNIEVVLNTPGIYFVTVITAEGQQAAKLIVK